jgi:hypothetical protein
MDNNSWIKPGYAVVKNVLNNEELEALVSEFKSLECRCKIVNDQSSRYMENKFLYYGYRTFERKLVEFIPKIEEIVKVKLTPTYSFGIIYHNNSLFERHIDRPCCEYTATICLKYDTMPWILWLEPPGYPPIPISLNNGDMLIFNGNEIPHWREKYNYSEHIQLLLHYVEKDGKYEKYKYDERRKLNL